MTWTELAPDRAVGLPSLRHILARPPGELVGSLAEWRRDQPPIEVGEAWNTAFEAGSLFEAWTRSPLMRSLHAASAWSFRPLLDARKDWTVVEVGGGDGSLWRQALRPDDRGSLVVVDPAEAPHRRVREAAPEGVEVIHVHGGIEHADLPEADVVVMSLVLHHVAGRDAGERERHGLPGPGKREILTRTADALRPRDGVLVLHEADVCCELMLPPGDPYLANRIADSYVRRCARALLDAIDTAPAPDDLRARWWAIIRLWCIDQLDVVPRPVADRDVYELAVPQWLELLDLAGFDVVQHAFTDRYDLFHRYVGRPR